MQSDMQVFTIYKVHQIGTKCGILRIMRHIELDFLFVRGNYSH